ncbi:hypothetical protein BB560_003074, partial [Smittium megazygosporum]
MNGMLLDSTAQRLAKAGLIPKMYIERCPFCNKNTPETIEHMLIECFRWNSIRHETTIFNIPRLYRTVTIDQSTNNQALNQVYIVLNKQCIRHLTMSTTDPSAAKPD